MEVANRASTAFLTAIFLIMVAAFPAAMAHSSFGVSAPAHAPSSALSPSGGHDFLASDGTAIDQGVAYVLMLVALIVTYLIH